MAEHIASRIAPFIEEAVAGMREERDWFKQTETKREALLSEQVAALRAELERERTCHDCKEYRLTYERERDALKAALVEIAKSPCIAALRCPSCRARAALKGAGHAL